MAKLKVQAQHLQPGDIVGSGEVVKQVIINSISHPSSKVKVTLFKNNQRTVLWGKYTVVSVERPMSEFGISKYLADKIEADYDAQYPEKAATQDRPSEDSKEHFDRYVAGDK